jgi:uncharacterized protein YacL
VQADDQVLAYSREKNGMMTYCIFNLSDKPAQFEVPVDAMNVMDVMTQAKSNLKKGETVDLKAWDYKIYSSI